MPNETLTVPDAPARVRRPAGPAALARTAARRAERESRAVAELAELRSRQAVYDLLPVVSAPSQQSSRFLTGVNIHEPHPLVLTVNERESVEMFGVLTVQYPAISRLANGPVKVRTKLVCFVPTGTAPDRRVKVEFSECVYGRKDPLSESGLRLVSAVVFCQDCDRTGTLVDVPCDEARFAVAATQAVLGARSKPTRTRAVAPIIEAHGGMLRAGRALYLRNNAASLEQHRAVIAGENQRYEETVARNAAAEKLSVALKAAKRKGRTGTESAVIEHTPTNKRTAKLFSAVYAKTKARIAENLPAIEPDVNRWLNASTRGFGIEIEFFVSDSVDTQTALRQIGSQLFEQLPAAVTTVSRNQQGYSAGQRNTTRWRFERDGTVDAEVVSPIMYDTPETWEQIALVLNIITSNGGVCRDPRRGSYGPRTAGGHIHVGVGDFGGNVTNHSNVAAIIGNFEDTIYRLSAAPGGNHRGLRYCNPCNDPVSIEKFSHLRNSQGHHLGVNWQSVEGSLSDHVEFRSFDSSLNLGTIQTQTRFVLAVADTAAKLAAEGIILTAHRTAVGSQYRTTARRRLTGTEWETATLPMRQLADLVCVDDNLKKQMFGLFSQGSWVKP